MSLEELRINRKLLQEIAESAIVEKFYSSIGKNEVQPVGESEPSKDGQFRITSDELSNLRPRGGYSFSTG